MSDIEDHQSNVVEEGQASVPPSSDEHCPSEKRVTTCRNGSSPESQQLMHTIAILLDQNSRMLQMLQSQQQLQTSPPHLTSVEETNHVRNFNVMPDLTKSMEDFDGEGGPGIANLWLKQMETTAQLHAWPDTFTFQTVCCHLKGAAKHWLNARVDVVTDWYTFKCAFEKNVYFPSK